MKPTLLTHLGSGCCIAAVETTLIGAGGESNPWSTDFFRPQRESQPASDAGGASRRFARQAELHGFGFSGALDCGVCEPTTRLAHGVRHKDLRHRCARRLIRSILGRLLKLDRFDPRSRQDKPRRLGLPRPCAGVALHRSRRRRPIVSTMYTRQLRCPGGTRPAPAEVSRRSPFFAGSFRSRPTRRG